MRCGGECRRKRYACRIQECFMSLSVAANNKNPFALWQSLLQPNSSTSGAQSDPLASLLASLNQGSGATTSTTGTAALSTATAGTPGSSSPQFGPQTLQALFDLQANTSNPQSLQAQLDGDGSANTSDPNASQQAQQGQGPHGHHHHHMDGAGGAGGSGAAASNNASSSASATSSSGGATVANNNLLERLIQMQAQLITPSTTQSIATV
jgi:hypothetical protein